MEHKKYWKGFEELSETPEFLKSKHNEFPEELPLLSEMKNVASEEQGSRRDFLKVLGFSMGAAAIAASCEIPIKKAIPYVNKPEEIIPGIATYYASSFVNGSDYCSVLVKTREGRPIKIEGNDLSGITQGGTSARAQASVVGLYDGSRLMSPKKGTAKTTWKAIDAEVKAKLRGLGGKKLVLLTSSILSPSTQAVINDFKQTYNAEQVVYEAISTSGIRVANERSFGKKVVPSYDFKKAEVIVGFDCDFLGTWVSPIEFTKQYVQNRKVSVEHPKMSKHWQFESRVTLAGSKADKRFTIKPSEEGVAVLALHDALKGGGGNKLSNANAQKAITKAALELKQHQGKSLVVSGSNDANVQQVVNAINEMLGNYGKTIDLNAPYRVAQGDDKAMHKLVNDMNAGSIGGLIVYNVNPAYNYFDAAKFKSGLKKVGVTISFNDRIDETAAAGITYLCPDNHYLESWGDVEPKTGYYGLIQPTIAPLFDTRSAEESLLVWANKGGNYYDYVKAFWQKNIFPKQKKHSSFQAFWDSALHDGVFELKNPDKTAMDKLVNMYNTGTTPIIVPLNTTNEEKAKAAATDTQAADHKEEKHADSHDEAAHAEETAAPAAVAPSTNVSAAVSAIKAKAGKANGLQLVMHESVVMGDGRYANNPFLQETPDPMSKVCWDNIIAVSASYAAANGLKEQDVVSLKAGNHTIEGQLICQPGQLSDTVSVALGYGRTNAGSEHCNTGSNTFPFVSFNGDTFNYSVTSGVSLSKVRAGNQYELAQTQTHHSVDDTGVGVNERPLIREAALENYKKDKFAGNSVTKNLLDNKDHLFFTLYGEDDTYGSHKTAFKQGHHWGLSVDLNTCTGCNACVVACNVENNVPIVGKLEVGRAHEMHWMRIDRYYSAEGFGTDEYMKNLEEKPQVTFMPMMCQHCDNAPCENVCPVAATNHSTEGLNQMAYNRCIGTRYCANNCPFKVRRFNWFDYQGADSFYKDTIFDNDEYIMIEDLTRMVLNPDVTVRSRGVMEKCSFCVQRIQEGKLTAKREGRALKDGDITTACQQGCPANAITFGDMNDPKSEITAALNNQRNYRLLEELHVLPSVSYLTQIRNREPWKEDIQHSQGGGHHGHDKKDGHDNHKGHDKHDDNHGHKGHGHDDGHGH
ncbi:MAG: TAT-variant-translocated molybdopterin oxidoreductase [Chitinophagales bacterium]